jgi:L-asparagine transporter-like permease
MKILMCIIVAVCAVAYSIMIIEIENWFAMVKILCAIAFVLTVGFNLRRIPKEDEGIG